MIVKNQACLKRAFWAIIPVPLVAFRCNISRNNAYWLKQLLHYTGKRRQEIKVVDGKANFPGGPLLLERRIPVRWTRKSIIAEINRLHEADEPLNYSAAESNHLNLVRAAAWHFGTWRHAVESAGVNYESLSRYQRWSKGRIVERIRELHQQKQDLNWRAVSTHVDPPLAAAALRANGFKSWREAVVAAGIDFDNVARYQYWDEAKVIKAIRARKRTGAPMSSKALQKADQCLFCAARRRFGSWDGALDAAGFNASKIRLRRYNPLLNTPRPRKTEADVSATDKTGKVAATKVAPPKPTAKPVAKKAAAKKATPVSPNGKAAAPIKIVAKKAAAKTPAAKAAPVKAASPKVASKKSAPTKSAPTKTASPKSSARKPASQRAAR